MSGSRYRKLVADSPSNSPTKQGVSSVISSDKCVMSSRSGGYKFSSALPSIGLHLNALAALSKDKIIVKSQSLTCRRQLIRSPHTISSADSVISDARLPTVKLEPEIVERESDEQNGVQVSENGPENSIFGDGVELPQCSPKKKRYILLWISKSSFSTSTEAKLTSAARIVSNSVLMFRLAGGSQKT